MVEGPADRPGRQPRAADVLSGTLESALYVNDLAAAEDFYAGVLGLPVIARGPGRHIFFRVGHSVLLVFDPAATEIPPPAESRIRVPPHGARGPGHYCFAVPPASVDTLMEQLQAKGIAIEQVITWPNGARSFYVRDPSGNSVEFADPALWH
jgi:catechol 2,3-dioxygenase-like lactoylglutathione lyase family enzyme